MSGDFRIGDWQIQPAVNRVRRGAHVLRLEPKVMHVLVCLAEANGEVVTRNELIRRVWPDVFVTDDVLHRAIRELRRLFGDSTTAPRYIETIRKRGYRLMVPASPDSSSEAARFLAQEPQARGVAAVDSPAVVAGTRRRAPWRFSVVAAAAGLTIAAAVFIVATPPTELAPQASARFVPVVSGPLNESDPAISPDGRRVAFAQRQASDARSADLFVRGSDGRVMQVTNHPASDRLPAWSPDGDRIAFVRVTSTACDIVVRDLRAGAEMTVAPCSNSDEPRLAWTADGRALLTAARPDPTTPTGSRIVRLALDTRAVTVLTAPAATIVGDDSPVLSPDGRRVAFIRRVSGGLGDVYVVPAGGGAARRVTFDEADLTGVDWSADGRFLIYSSDRAGGYSLFRVAADGGTPTLLAGGAARMKHPVADRAARRVVYENWQYEINVWEVPLTPRPSPGTAGAQPSPQAPRAVTRTSDLWNLYPQVSPDGTQLAYVSTQSGGHELWLAQRDGSGARQLTHLGGGVVKLPRWSPDGRRLVYLARGRGGAVDVHVVDVTTGRATPLTASPATESAPSWSHDSTRVFFGAPDAEGRWSVWSVDAAGRHSVPQLQLTDAVAAQPSGDGEWLYFTRPDRPGLWRAPAGEPAASASVVFAGVPSGDALGWTVTSQGVYVVHVRDGEVQLSLLPHAADAITPIAQLTQFSWPGFSVTPDGAHVLYARWDRRESNLMSLEY